MAVAKKTAVALKSPSMSFIEAASLPIAGCTAVQALRDLGKLSKGTNALIIGALLAGRHPIELTPTRLLRLSKNLPHDWKEQRRFLGFAA